MFKKIKEKSKAFFESTVNFIVIGGAFFGLTAGFITLLLGAIGLNVIARVLLAILVIALIWYFFGDMIRTFVLSL
tara:strand:- start:538 stop:762 length:225 start_codon:yes stop_codon:yes gene_type:complete